MKVQFSGELYFRVFQQNRSATVMLFGDHTR